MRSLFALCALLAACVQQTSAPTSAPVDERALSALVVPEDQSSIENFLADNPAYVWRISTIPVCWESFSDSTAPDRQLVQDAVKNSWESHSRISFDFSPNVCTANEDGIHIRVADDADGAFTRGLGNQLRRRAAGMTLNFTLRNWTPACPEGRNLCLKSIAVHEFGHALGFAHEHMRFDAQDCGRPPAGSTPTRELTDWDINSVMNYCNARPNNHGVLSQLDIQGLQRVYGRP